MYNVLVVEDEKLELNALCSILEKHCPQIRKVVPCDNGDAVLELLETYTPDIVLMDIHLGSANGIDLSSEIREMIPGARIIIITAFDQFSYAQKAVQLGLADYLLKPVSTKKLLTTMDEQFKVLDDQRLELIERVRYQKSLTALQSVVYSSLMNRIIYNCINTDAKRAMEMVQLPTNHMQLLVVTLNPQEFDFSDSEILVLKKLIIDSLVAAFAHTVLLYDYLSTSEIVLCGFFPDQESLVQANLLQTVQHVLDREYRIPYRIGISDTVSDLDALPAAYKRALSALQISDGTICADYDLFYEGQGDFYVDAYTDDLTDCLAKMDPLALDRVLSGLFRVGRRSFSNLSEAKAAIITLWVTTMQELEVRLSYSVSGSDNMLDPISDYYACDNTDELFEHCRTHFSFVLKTIEDLLMKKKNHIAFRARQYIEKHYSETLTLQSISEALKISPYYLCHVFKESLNIGVIEFMNTCRIESAKTLLRAGDTSVKEVANAVGFPDPNYFCRAFKRMVGVSPSVYKRLNP